MCPILKKLSNKLQPFGEVLETIKEIQSSKRGNEIRVLEHLLSYAEYQFGKETPGKTYRERGNGERMRNWEVQYNLEYLLQQLFRAEHSIAVTAIKKRHFDIAERHCERSLAYARGLRVEGGHKTTAIFGALRIYCSLREREGNYSDALTIAEECYNLVVVAYDPVHIEVQEAAGVLIDILIAKGDYFDAERFAQITYSNLRDRKNGMDQESKEVAMGAHNLADVIYRQKGNLIKAEELAREALRIRSSMCDFQGVGISCDLLANIFMSQSNFGDETREFFERSLANFIRYEGPDGQNTATAHSGIGNFFIQLAEIQPTGASKRTHLLLAQAHFKEAQRIDSILYGPTHPNTSEIILLLSTMSSVLSKI